MDKYEEAAREVVSLTRDTDFEHEGKWVEYILRWYDERREKETCEWTRTVRGEGETHWYEWERACKPMGVLERQTQPEHYCPSCGRRIVEKEACDGLR